MSESASQPAPLHSKKKGCLWLVLIVGTTACISVLPSAIKIFSNGPKLQIQAVLKDIRNSISNYEVDYGHYPLPDSDSRGSDVIVRSRGPLLTALMGDAVTPLNPRAIKYIDLPLAKNRKYGVWQDGAEWVLSDAWGEPYYIILDINKDDKLANPEFGAVISDPKRAEYYQKYLPPEKLPMTMAIYSSGPDRDPKTWDDNICTWRTR